MNPDKSKAEFAKTMTAACVRRGYLEKLHFGITPTTKTGDYSDVRVIDAEGREIPWNQVSRINQAEMKLLITGVVNRIYTFLSRTLFSTSEDHQFIKALDRCAIPWTRNWDEPKYLPEFLMPGKEKERRVNLVWVLRGWRYRKIGRSSEFLDQDRPEKMSKQMVLV